MVFLGVSKQTFHQLIRLYVDYRGDGAISIRDVLDEGNGWTFPICADYAATGLWSALWHWLRALRKSLLSLN